MKKTFISIIILAIAGGLAYYFFAGGEKTVKIELETAKAERVKITKSVTATGTIEAVTKVDVGTQVSGIISNIYVDYNDNVRKGQVIAELDKTNLTSELNSAKANLASAKSDLEYNELNFKRQQSLYEKGLISANEFETAQLSYVKSKQSYAFQTESVKKAETNLGYAIITSPIDGVILAKDVEEGQTVAASFNTPTLFTIAQDLTDMRVIAKVDEADIGEVKEGQRATFTVDAYPDDQFEGKVTQVRQNGETENNVVTYEVVISAPNPDLKLKPALTANVTLFTLEVDNVLSVPTKAFRFQPNTENLPKGYTIEDCDGSQKVWINEGNVVKALSLETGLSNGTRTEVLKGIDEGTEVIVGVNVEGAAMKEAATERSPFAPGPPKQKNSSKK